MAICLAALLLLSTNLCHAFPTTQGIDDGSSPTPSHGVETCLFGGNPNLYGLGIRSGVYIITFATVLASIFKQRTAIELSKIGALFHFAIFVALLRETITHSEQLHAVEALVTSLVCLSSLAWASFDDPTGRDNHCFPNHLEKKTLPNLVSLLRQLTVLGVSVYQAWFWFLGVNKLQHLSCATGTHTFFLARVDMNGPFQVFAKIWSVLVIIWVAVIIAFRLLNCQLQQRGAPTVFKLLLAGFFLGVIIAAVELTLKWNNVGDVSDVTGAGQSIPLIVGIGMFVGMFLNWEGRDWMIPKHWGSIATGTTSESSL